MIEIEIGGRLRPFECNQAAMDVYFPNLNYTEIGASAIYATYYSGLIGGCIRKKEQADFTWDDVFEWVEQLQSEDKIEEIEKVCAVFAEANTYKQRLAKFISKINGVSEDENVKKNKAQRKKSS